MLLDKCPHCNASHVQANQRFRDQFKAGVDNVLWDVVRCQNPTCTKLVLAVLGASGVQKIYPSANFELDESINIAAEIREDFQEAGNCLGADCYKASMVMSRRALQRCLKENGCTQRNLVNAIDHALEHNILRPAFRPIAEEIREYGNLGAHPDDEQLSNVTRENAQQILDFVRLIIHDFYEVPAAAVKLRQGRGGQENSQ